jgi:hypothetical protein
MKLNILMVLNTIVAGVFGIAFVLIPGQLVSWYGVNADVQLVYIARLFGAALMALALVSWMARNAAESDARQAIVTALAVGDIVGFVVALMAQLGGVVNGLGWTTVVIYFLLGLGFGSFALRKPPSAA